MGVVMAYCFEFEMDGLPSVNPADNTHWRAVGREKKRWIDAVHWKTVGRRPKAPLAQARVTFTRCSSVEPDSDNLAYSFKRVRDALCRPSKKNPGGCGILQDDDPERLEAVYLWEKASPRAGKVRVRIEEVS
jgi:hypothetical protein